jgi:hypothetical protein
MEKKVLFHKIGKHVTLNKEPKFNVDEKHAGCMLHASGSGRSASPSTHSTAAATGQIATGVVFVLVQVLCSVIAGVYNEYIIKGNRFLSVAFILHN